MFFFVHQDDFKLRIASKDPYASNRTFWLSLKHGNPTGSSFLFWAGLVAVRFRKDFPRIFPPNWVPPVELGGEATFAFPYQLFHGSARWKEYKKKLKETGDRDLVYRGLRGAPKAGDETVKRVSRIMAGQPSPPTNSRPYDQALLSIGFELIRPAIEPLLSLRHSQTTSKMKNSSKPKKLRTWLHTCSWLHPGGKGKWLKVSMV